MGILDFEVPVCRLCDSAEWSPANALELVTANRAMAAKESSATFKVLVLINTFGEFLPRRD